MLTANKAFILGYTADYSNVYDKGECIIIDDFTLDMKYVNFKFKIKSSAIKILTTIDHNLFFCYLNIQNMRIATIGHNRHYISIVQNNKIFVPSILEQQKIAKFFSLLDKQIELWNTKLQLSELIFKMEIKIDIKKMEKNEKFRLKTLDKICDIKKGYQPRKEQLSNYGYKYLNGGKEKSGFSELFNVYENSITISEGGESCGFVSYNNEKIWAGCHLYILNPKNKIDKKFLYFFLKEIEKNIMKKRVGSSIPNIQKKDIEKIKILISDNVYLQENISHKWNIYENRTFNIKIKLYLLKKVKKYYLKNVFL